MDKALINLPEQFNFFTHNIVAMLILMIQARDIFKVFAARQQYRNSTCGINKNITPVV